MADFFLSIGALPPMANVYVTCAIMVFRDLFYYGCLKGILIVFEMYVYICTLMACVLTFQFIAVPGYALQRFLFVFFVSLGCVHAYLGEALMGNQR